MDLLSRNPTEAVNRTKRGTHETNEYEEPEIQDEEELNNPPSITIEEFIEAQDRDTFCSKMIDDLDNFTRFKIWNRMLVESNPFSTALRRVVVPETLFQKVMYQVHDGPLSAHPGYRRTLWRFNQRYCMPRALARIKHNVKTCHLGKTKKDPWTRRCGLLQPLQCTERPFQRIGIDTLGPFRKSKHGNVKS